MIFIILDRFTVHHFYRMGPPRYLSWFYKWLNNGFMVDITIVNGDYNGCKPTYNWGGPSCTHSYGNPSSEQLLEQLLMW